MKSFITPFSVGLVVLGALVAAIWMFGVVSEGIGDDPNGYHVYAYFKDAGGMTEKSKVVIAGINVGQIDHIELEGVQAKVWLFVNVPLTSDARIAKRSSGILGDYYLQLTPGYTGTALKEGDEIANVDYDVEMTTLMNELGEVVSNVKEVTAALKRVVDDRTMEDQVTGILKNVNASVAELKRIILENSDKVDRVIDNVVKLSDESRDFIKEVKREAGNIIKDVKVVMKDVRNMADNARVVIEDVRVAISGPSATSGSSSHKATSVQPAGIIGQSSASSSLPATSDKSETLGKQSVTANASSSEPALASYSSPENASYPETSNGALTRLQSALDNLDRTLEHTNSIVEKIDSGEGTVGKLINDDHLASSVNEVVDEAKDFVVSLTSLQTIVGIRSEYYAGLSSVKNYVSLRLQPRPDKYYLIQLVDDPRGSTKFRETITRTSDSTEDPIIHEQQTITDDKFKLSLEFAKRFYMFTGRVGIIEGSGGVGLDASFFDDQLQISSDLFGFSDNVNPHLKFWARYTFFTHLYVAAGIDEVLNEELRDYFVGVGIEFNDTDLKALISVAP